MQKRVNLVDLVKSFPTNIYLQNLASIQKRTSPVKFAHLAEKSGKGSISNLSTKVNVGLKKTATRVLGNQRAVALTDALKSSGVAVADVLDGGVSPAARPRAQYAFDGRCQNPGDNEIK